MALSAAATHLATREVELRDLDFVQALELHDDACQTVATRIDLETGTVEISSHPRLTDDEPQTHARARFARIPSDHPARREAPPRREPNSAPVRDEI